MNIFIAYYFKDGAFNTTKNVGKKLFISWRIWKRHFMNTVVLLQQNHIFVFKNIFSLSAFRNFND